MGPPSLVRGQRLLLGSIDESCFDGVLNDICGCCNKFCPSLIPTNVTYLTVRRNTCSDSPIINNMRPR
jgi:hypothetical protein